METPASQPAGRLRPEELNVIVATDCGSTTTKAILIERKADGYHQTFRGEAPTTVEAPCEDVTRGVLNALGELEELSGRRILDGERIITPARGDVGVDVYVSTSSAGGGLQMMVAGVVESMSAQSAQRAAPFSVLPNSSLTRPTAAPRRATGRARIRGGTGGAR